MLERLFSPRSIAVIGASRTPGKLGYEVLHNCIQFGFEGEIYPVNPNAESILGKKSYASIADIGDEVDVAVLVLPKEGVVQAVTECGKKGVGVVVIITAGFRETGAAGFALEEEVRLLGLKYRMRIVGPNCLGFLNTRAKLNASFTEGLPREGSVALISQSGAMCVSILDWAKDVGMGFSHVVTIGNKVDISEVELLASLEEDPHTEVIALYLESIEHGERLLAAAQRVALHKPIVLIKSGLSVQGERAVQSHTGALAGSSEAIAALCEKAGIIQVHSAQEFFDVTLLLSCGRMPKGNRVAIITNAGGPGVLTVDALEHTQLTLAELSPKTQSTLREHLPSAASVRNPIDIIGDATPERYAWALAQMNEQVADALIVILTPQVMTHPAEAARTIVRAYAQLNIPVICSFMGGGSVHEARSILNAAAIPHVSTPERAVHALHMVVRAQELSRITRAYNTHRATTPIQKKNTHSLQLRTQEVESFLRALNLSIVDSTLLSSIEECETLEQFPVVMKIASRDIIHKSAAGGVQLNILSVQDARKAFAEIQSAIRVYKGTAEQEGVLVQPQLPHQKNDIELFVGIKKDPSCGMIIVCGFGGTDVEVVRDVAYALAPLSHDEARLMLSQLKRYPLLHNADVESFIELLVKLSSASVQYTGFSSIDLNPVVLHSAGNGYTILDARILI